MQHFDRSGLFALEPLDVATKETIGQLVDGMSRCSFGARMLGDVAATLTEWASNPLKRACIIYDGKPHTPLGELLQQMLANGWFSALIRTEDYYHRWPRSTVGPNALVVGPYSQLHARVFNDAGSCDLHQSVRHGSAGKSRWLLPDAVF